MPRYRQARIDSGRPFRFAKSNTLSYTTGEKGSVSHRRFILSHSSGKGRKEGTDDSGKRLIPICTVRFFSFLLLNRACKIEWTEVKKNKKVQQKKLRACVSLFRARSHSLSICEWVCFGQGEEKSSYLLRPIFLWKSRRLGAKGDDDVTGQKLVSSMLVNYIVLC